MSPAPAVPEAAAYLYDELAIAQPGDDLRGYPLLLLLGAVATALGPLHDLARHPERLLDPDQTPAYALPYLAQFAGVHFPDDDTPEAAQRSRITRPPAFQRGTLSATRMAVQATLTGTKSVRFIERNGGPYSYTVITRTSQTPNAAASAAAAASQKPAGYLLTFLVSDSPLIDEGTRLGDNVTAIGDAALLADVT